MADNYKVYLNEIRMPVAPSKVTYSMKSGNKTVTMVSGEEINVIGKPKLMEVKMELRLPANNAPYAFYKDRKFKLPKWYLRKIESMRKSEDGIKVKILRTVNDYSFKKNDLHRKKKQSEWRTYFRATIEECEVKEDAEETGDVLVSISLKRYRSYGVKRAKIVVDKKTGKGKITTDPVFKSNYDVLKIYKKYGKTYTVQKGDTLYLIAKKVYGNVYMKSWIYQNNSKLIEYAARKMGYKSSTNGKLLVPGIKLTILSSETIRKAVEMNGSD